MGSEKNQRSTRHQIGKRVLVYGLLGVFLVFYIPHMVRGMIYPVPAVKVSSPAPQPFVDVPLEVDGNKISAWFRAHENPDAPIILFFHGNGENLQTMLNSGVLNNFHNLGAHLLAIDYPGYGLSDGKPSEESLVASGSVAYEWVLTHYPAAHKVIMGWSLGAGVALQTAQLFEGHFDALILMSPWTSLPDVARTRFPSWLVNRLVKDQYDSLSIATTLATQSLVIHGKEDAIIPALQGYTIADSLGRNGQCQWLEVDNLGHNDLFYAAIVWRHLKNFLDQSDLESGPNSSG